MVHKLVLIENDIINVASLSLRKRPQFHYLDVNTASLVRIEGDFTLVNDLTFLFKYGAYSLMIFQWHPPDQIPL